MIQILPGNCLLIDIFGKLLYLSGLDRYRVVPHTSILCTVLVTLPRLDQISYQFERFFHNAIAWPELFYTFKGPLKGFVDDDMDVLWVFFCKYLHRIYQMNSAHFIATNVGIFFPVKKKKYVYVVTDLYLNIFQLGQCTWNTHFSLFLNLLTENVCKLWSLISSAKSQVASTCTHMFT